MKELMARRERAQADLKELETGDTGQVSKTDSDARLLSKGDQTIAGYNVQSVVDDKHKLIVASEVVNRSDAGHLHEMAKAAKEILEAETLQILADTAYYNSEDLKACEDDGVVAYVPPHEGNGKLEKQGRFVRKDFSYDAATNTYRCPAGQLLHPTKTPWTNTSGRIEIRYLGSKATCGACPLKVSCLSSKAEYRSVSRWEHEDVLDRHRQRMANEGAGELMRRRSAIVEHPFGTLKCRAGYQHFLVRGFDKVRGEWSLMALCYNFTRMLNILGFDHFVAYMAEKARVARESDLFLRRGLDFQCAHRKVICPRVDLSHRELQSALALSAKQLAARHWIRNCASGNPWIPGSMRSLSSLRERNCARRRAALRADPLASSRNDGVATCSVHRSGSSRVWRARCRR